MGGVWVGYNGVAILFLSLLCSTEYVVPASCPVASGSVAVPTVISSRFDCPVWILIAVHGLGGLVAVLAGHWDVAVCVVFLAANSHLMWTAVNLVRWTPLDLSI